MSMSSPSVLRSLAPVRHPGIYAFVSVASATALASVATVATVREPEGLSAVVTESDAVAHGLPIRFRAAWIMMSAQTALEDVGITAAFAAALANAGISCNVFAGVYHDHLFLPVERADEALAVLAALGHERS
jgi:uncharacterized protein